MGTLNLENNLEKKHTILRLFKEGPAKNLGKKTRTTIFRLFGEGPMEKTKEHQKSLKETETCKNIFWDSLGRSPWRKQEAPKEHRENQKNKSNQNIQYFEKFLSWPTPWHDRVNERDIVSDVCMKGILFQMTQWKGYCLISTEWKGWSRRWGHGGADHVYVYIYIHMYVCIHSIYTDIGDLLSSMTYKGFPVSFLFVSEVTPTGRQPTSFSPLQSLPVFSKVRSSRWRHTTIGLCTKPCWMPLRALWRQGLRMGDEGLDCDHYLNRILLLWSDRFFLGIAKQLPNFKSRPSRPKSACKVLSNRPWSCASPPTTGRASRHLQPSSRWINDVDIAIWPI